MNSPEEQREEFDNLDGDKELNDDLLQFWSLCGNNRNAGVGQLLRNSRVSFRDVCALKVEEDEEVKDMKAMLKELPVMIETLPMDHSMKAIVTTEFENEIRDCRNSCC